MADLSAVGCAVKLPDHGAGWCGPVLQPINLDGASSFCVNGLSFGAVSDR